MTYFVRLAQVVGLVLLGNVLVDWKGGSALPIRPSMTEKNGSIVESDDPSPLGMAQTNISKEESPMLVVQTTTPENVLIANNDKETESSSPVLDEIQVWQQQYLQDFTSPVCLPGRRENHDMIRRLYFSHTRKAGGTTFRNLFDRIARHKKWQLDIREGKAGEAPVRNDTLYVTNLRDPMARVLSAFYYEGRWKCRQLVRNHSFVPTAENAASFQEFLAKCSENKDRFQCGRKKRLWGCAENCYLRWFGQPFNCLKDPLASYQSALQKLLGYDLIIITEFLKDPGYVRGLLGYFGIHNEKLAKDLPGFCTKQSRHWNKVYPTVVSNDSLAELEQLNQLDTLLYRTLTTCPDGIQFESMRL